MKKESLNKAENPILQGAEQLRSIVKTSVKENLKDIFPKNYQCMHGNYDLIYVIASGHGDRHNGFYDTADMVVLTPEGDIQSGEVYQRVESDHSAWEFEQAKLEKASDLEVVRCMPQLVKNLFEQLEDELSEEKDPKKITRGLNYLFNNQDMVLKVSAISCKALKEMGEEDPKIAIRDSGQPGVEGLAEIIQAIKEQHPELEIVGKLSRNSSLDQKKAAIDLFMNKISLMDELREISANMRASLVEERFEEIVKEMVGKNIFPVTWEDEQEMGWFGNKEINWTTLSKPIYSKGRHERSAWCISVDGQVREFEKKSNDVFVPYFCAEHLLKQAPEILGQLVDASAKTFFENIKI